MEPPAAGDEGLGEEEEEEEGCQRQSESQREEEKESAERKEGGGRERKPEREREQRARGAKKDGVWREHSVSKGEIEGNDTNTKRGSKKQMTDARKESHGERQFCKKRKKKETYVCHRKEQSKGRK